MNMYCNKDCNCNICRELRTVKSSKSFKRIALRPSLANSSLLDHINGNFILKRPTFNSIQTFQPQSLRCDEMCQQHQCHEGEMYDFCKRYIKTPSPTTITDIPSNGQMDQHRDQHGDRNKKDHKIVIYFGDSLKRTKPNVNAFFEKGQIEKYHIEEETSHSNSVSTISTEEALESLPYFIESLDDGVISIKIHKNYQTASNLVRKISEPYINTDVETANSNIEIYEDRNSEREMTNDNRIDWSFVQKWRER